MFYGKVRFEDTVLAWSDETLEDGKVRYTVVDMPTGQTESLVVDKSHFFNTLSIFVHNDGMPDYNKDYDDAEAIQPTNPKLRWIP